MSKHFLSSNEEFSQSGLVSGGRGGGRPRGSLRHLACGVALEGASLVAGCSISNHHHYSSEVMIIIITIIIVIS